MMARESRWTAPDEAAIGRLLDAADDARLRGDLPAAADQLTAAIAAIGVLAERRPDDPRHIQMLGSTGYTLGAVLVDDARPVDAIGALDAAEQAYSRLPGTYPDAGAWIADVRCRRGLAKGMAGRGASAVVDVQAAAAHHRSSRPQTVDDLDLARVLSPAADVLAVFGDPDLAVAAADWAIRAYLQQSTRINSRGHAGQHWPYLLRAAIVAAEVHEAHDRADLANEARRLIRAAPAILDRAAVRTLLHSRMASDNPPLLATTVATALAAAGADAELQTLFVRPATDVQLLVPLERVLLSGDGLDMQLVHDRGASLAAVACALLPDDPASGMRLGLEAHYLFAGMSELPQTLTARYDFQVLAPPWARVLIACCRGAEAAGDLALAEDLAGWIGGIVTALDAATYTDVQARKLAQECLQAQSRVRLASGDLEAARAADHLAARLDDMNRT